MRGLYAIVDTKTLRARHVDPVAFAGAVLTARPAALQIRGKDTSPRELLAILRAVSPLCQQAGVPFVVNDRADLAALAACGIVHVGQEDLSIERVRRIAPGMRVGVSTHNLEQLARALDAAPAYVAYGPVYPTESKANPDPVVGVEGLRQAALLARRARTPLVAIGGITLERAAEVGRIADAAAAIGALVPPDSVPAGKAFFDAVAARAKELHEVLCAGRPETPRVETPA